MKKKTRNILTAIEDRGKFNLYGEAVELLNLTDEKGLMFWLNKNTKIGTIKVEPKDDDNFKPRIKSVHPYRQFKSKPLYKHFKECFNLTGNINRFEIKEINGVFTFELIKKKKDLRYY